jgi:hypothetical protein
LERSIKFDDKLYRIKGSPFFDLLTYKPVNDYTNKTTATITVATYGKSRVVRLIGTDAKEQKFTEITYYDKQQ